MLFHAALSLVAASLVAAQSTTLQLQAIQAHFANAGLTGSGNTALLSTFNPNSVLDVNFGSGNIAPGTPEAVAAVANPPTLTLTPANSSVSTSGQYTVAMIDADVVGTVETNQTRHWLVNGVSVSGGAVNALAGTNITAYGGPLPASGSGPHRYVILVLAQPSTFTAPADPAPGSPIAAFDFNAYVTSAGLGPIVAGSYYTVEQGTATASIPATSAVQTATLPAAQSGSASGGSAHGSATGTAPAPSKTGGSAIGKSVHWGLAAVAFLFAAL